MVSGGINIHHFVCIGHSLGAHVCGIAGHYLTIEFSETEGDDVVEFADIIPVVIRNFVSLKLQLIIGLDPAKILFRIADNRYRLDQGDAKLVIIIHSATGYFGVEEPSGDYDLYINGGAEQPGCNPFRLPYALGNSLKSNTTTIMIISHFLFK